MNHLVWEKLRTLGRPRLVPKEVLMIGVEFILAIIERVLVEPFLLLGMELRDSAVHIAPILGRKAWLP